MYSLIFSSCELINSNQNKLDSGLLYAELINHIQLLAYIPISRYVESPHTTTETRLAVDFVLQQHQWRLQITNIDFLTMIYTRALAEWKWEGESTTQWIGIRIHRRWCFNILDVYTLALSILNWPSIRRRRPKGKGEGKRENLQMSLAAAAALWVGLSFSSSLFVALIIHFESHPSILTLISSSSLAPLSYCVINSPRWHEKKKKKNFCCIQMSLRVYGIPYNCRSRKHHSTTHSLFFFCDILFFLFIPIHQKNVC